MTETCVLGIEAKNLHLFQTFMQFIHSAVKPFICNPCSEYFVISCELTGARGSFKSVLIMII